jgi:hypothetical protein
MNITDSGTPVTSSNWDHSKFGIDKGTLDGNLDFFANLDTNTDVTISITNSANSLESGTLTGFGLLLDREDAHDVIGENFLKGLTLMLVLEEHIDNLGFFDWNGSSVDFFERFNLSHLDESTQLGERHPVLTLATEATTASAAATSTSTATSVAASSATSSEASTAASSEASTAITTGWWSITRWSFTERCCLCWCWSIHA